MEKYQDLVASGHLMNEHKHNGRSFDPAVIDLVTVIGNFSSFLENNGLSYEMLYDGLSLQCNASMEEVKRWMVALSLDETDEDLSIEQVENFLEENEEDFTVFIQAMITVYDLGVEEMDSEVWENMKKKTKDLVRHHKTMGGTIFLDSFR